MQATDVILNFLVATLEKKSEIDFHDRVYGTHYIQNISTPNQYKDYYRDILHSYLLD